MKERLRSPTVYRGRGFGEVGWASDRAETHVRRGRPHSQQRLGCVRGSLRVKHEIIRFGARKGLSLQIEQVPGSLNANSRCLWEARLKGSEWLVVRVTALPSRRRELGRRRKGWACF